MTRTKNVLKWLLILLIIFIASYVFLSFPIIVMPDSTEYYGYLKEAHYIEEQYSKLFNEDQELFNKKFGDVIRNKIKLKRPKPQSQGIKNLLKYK